MGTSLYRLALMVFGLALHPSIPFTNKRAGAPVFTSSLLSKQYRFRGSAKRNRAYDANSSSTPLLSLGENLVPAIFVRRPSSRNKSPFVGDVQLMDGREAIAHFPSLDMGGKLYSGVNILLKIAVDKRGNPIGSNQVGKYGTPKCEFIMQLLKNDEPENAATKGCWVGAHPKLGELVAKKLLRSGRLTQELGGAALTGIQHEVTAVAGTDMRCDFLVTHEDGSKTMIEVKTVVDTDYDPAFENNPAFRPLVGRMFVGRPEKTGGKYVRSAIFPWGRGRQRGPDNEKVVSSRAIKHIRELTRVARGELTEANGASLRSAVLFVVVRGDADFFRPNHEACPSFARYVRKAHEAGVRILAHRICWGLNGSEVGKAYHGGSIPVELDYGAQSVPNKPLKSSRAA